MVQHNGTMLLEKSLKNNPMQKLQVLKALIILLNIKQAIMRKKRQFFLIATNLLIFVVGEARVVWLQFGPHQIDMYFDV